MKSTLIRHLSALAILIAVAFLYALPALQGNKLSAGDTVHWMGMSEEARAWHEKTGENPMWSNSMFGGMPTVTHYMRGKTNLIYPIQEFLTDALPLPIPFFLIAMLCFYVLMMSWRVNRWVAVGGAIVFAFASYNLQIIAAGHNTKMFSIGYMPLVLAGMHWVYQKRYLAGAGAALFGLSLMISNAMYQIDYYLVFILGGMAIGYAIQAFRNNTLKDFAIASGIMLGVGLVSVGPSLDQLMLTREYTTQTMRGGQSELTLGKQETKKDGGLDKDYAFQWSQSLGETFTLFVPNLYGGGSRTDVGTGSAVYETLSSMAGEQTAEQFSRNATTYWGPQPFLSGPVYFGIILMLLSIMGLFLIRHPLKWVLFALALFGIMLSWGKHFSAFNYFLFDHLPMYNKFRTPSMAMVIPGLMFAVLGLWTLNEYLSGEYEEKTLLEVLKKSLIITGGIVVLFGFGSRMFMDFKGPNDAQLQQQLVQMTGGNEQVGAKIYQAIVEDRPGLATKDGLRSLAILLLGGGLLWMFSKRRLDGQKTAIALSVLMAIDLLSLGTRYLNSGNYMTADEFEAQFQPRAADQQIKQDPDPYYRVLDLTRDPYNDAMGAYHHKLVGGYHPAKMEPYQDLITHQLSGGKMNAEVLNMLNTKYILYGDEGKPDIQPNPMACGNAWFVQEVKVVNDANEEMLALNAGNFGDTAMVNNPFRARQMAVVQKKHWSGQQNTFTVDSSAGIRLTKYGLNDLSFESNNAAPGFAVFADVYYPLGWKAFVDGKETPIVKTDYLLRGLLLPAGKHTVEFRFHPDTYFKWNMPSLASSILIWLVLLGGIGLSARDSMKKEEKAA